ncbi:MAG: hypothetical protein SFZ23_04480 [Planctomycetota bacterium]|nr:hypothetical protein [Planctomycetota bacterium]
MKWRHWRRAALGVACSVVSLAATAGRASGDEYVDRANALYADIRPEARSDTVMLGVLGAMTPPPAVVGTVEKAALLPATSESFAQAAAWVQEPTQRAVLAALEQVTRAADYRDAFAFGQPYGVDGVPRELIAKQLYTELGDPPTLAAAQTLYLDAIRRAGVLVHVEATRLASSGDPQAACDLLLRWTLFGRQVADRQFYREAVVGYDIMIRSLERIRDVLHADMFGERKVKPEWFRAVLKRPRQSTWPHGLMAEQHPFNLNRLKFPEADLIGAEQVVARVFTPQGAPDPANFAGTLAAIGSADRPLRLFAESARWRTAAASHAPQAGTSRMLDIAFTDIKTRWALGPFDKRNKVPLEYKRLDRSTYAVITMTMPDLSELLPLRELVRVEAGGTFQAMAIVAWLYEQKSMPTVITAVAPSFIETLPLDPLNPDSAISWKKPFYEYFRPGTRGRDTSASTENAVHEIRVILGETRFLSRVSSEDFIVYSVGSDGVKNWADNVQNTTQVVSNADYLIWPSTLTLHRRYLADTNQLP